MAFDRTIQERVNALLGESDLRKYTVKEGLNHHLGVDLDTYTKNICFHVSIEIGYTL